MNIKEIKTEKFEGLAILMTKGAVNIDISMGYILVKEWNELNGVTDAQLSNPYRLQKYLSSHKSEKDYVTRIAATIDGEYIKMGKANDITEEQCMLIVPENMNQYNEECYPDFTPSTNNLSCAYVNAKSSFSSLMQSLQCYFVNPYGDKPEFEDQHDPFYGDSLIQWVQAQENTGNWMIFKKLKNG